MATTQTVGPEAMLAVANRLEGNGRTEMVGALTVIPEGGGGGLHLCYAPPVSQH